MRRNEESALLCSRCDASVRMIPGYVRQRGGRWRETYFRGEQDINLVSRQRKSHYRLKSPKCLKPSARGPVVPIFGTLQPSQCKGKLSPAQ